MGKSNAQKAAEEAEAREAAEAEAREAAEAEAKEAGMVRVRPTKFSMHEPFQGIKINMGQTTPVELSNWVESQIEQGLLEEV